MVVASVVDVLCIFDLIMIAQSLVCIAYHMNKYISDGNRCRVMTMDNGLEVSIHLLVI